MIPQEQKIALTSANIRNSYIRLGQFKRLINDVSVKNEAILVDLDGIGPVETRFDRIKGIIAARKAIRRFFEIHHLQAGDEITVSHVDRHKYQITPNIGKDNMTKPSIETNFAPSEGGSQAVLEKQMALFESKKAPRFHKNKRRKNGGQRANDLSGTEWTSYSVSVWRDLRKSSEELRLDHPAMFPLALVKRVIQCFTNRTDRTVLDPFMGSGSTLMGAFALGKHGIGFEIYPAYVELAEQRLHTLKSNKSYTGSYVIHQSDASRMGNILRTNSIDLCLTSPPYWNILTQRRTADYKEIRHYGNSTKDLGQIADYNEFLKSLTGIFKEIHKVLKPGKYCIVNVMDIRKRNHFYPFHSDLAQHLESAGFLFDDLIIWDRSHEYNNLRPLGYPAVFRINKVHEYLLIFQKPLSGKEQKHVEKED